MTTFIGPSRSSGNVTLDECVRRPVTSSVIEYLTRQATLVVRYQDPALVSSSSNLISTATTTLLRHITDASRPPLPPLRLFIQSLVHNASVQSPILMTSMVYITRLRSRLAPDARGMRCAAHRIVLASMILAAKTLTDSCTKNACWPRYATVNGYEGFGFALPEINLMERRLLFLLDWNIGLSEEDLLKHSEPFLAPVQLQPQLGYDEHDLRPRPRQRTQNFLTKLRVDSQVKKSAPFKPSQIATNARHRELRPITHEVRTECGAIDWTSTAPASTYTKVKPFGNCGASSDSILSLPLVHSSTDFELIPHTRYPPSLLDSSRLLSFASSSLSSSAAPSNCSTPITAPTMLNCHFRENGTPAIADQSYSPGTVAQSACCGRPRLHVEMEEVPSLPKVGTNGQQYSCVVQIRPPAKKRKYSDVKHLSSSAGKVVETTTR